MQKNGKKLYRLNSSRLTHNMAFRVIYRRMSWRDITSKANESWASFSRSLSLKTLIVLVFCRRYSRISNNLLNTILVTRSS